MWLGLDNLYYLTQAKDYSLRITMVSQQNQTAVANYDHFKILDRVRTKLQQTEVHYFT